jgi:cell shape-determining protein MreC
MKLILFTIIVVLSVAGLGVGIYFEKWDTVIMNAPFTVHFAYQLTRAYQNNIEQTHIQSYDQEQEIEQLKQEIKKLTVILAKLVKRK